MNGEKENTSYGKKAILIADPDITVFYLLSELPAMQDIELIHTSNGSEAVELFRKNPGISFLITELTVPGLDGFGILRAIRKINRSVPAIAQTALAQPGIQEQCLNAGFNECIFKPVKLNLFDGILKKYMLLSA